MNQILLRLKPKEDCLLYEFSNECLNEKMLKKVFCGGLDIGEGVMDTYADNIINCGKVGMICDDGACRKPWINI